MRGETPLPFGTGASEEELMSGYTRRQCFELAAVLAVAGAPAGRRAAGQPRGGRNRDDCTLSIGTYSMKGLPLEEAITRVAAIGYDGIEIATQPGFDGEPAKLPPERRAEVRKRLDDTGLKLTAL